MHQEVNPVVILTRNCLALTKRCIESVRNQSIETTIYAVDNGSTDGTPDWLTDQGIIFWDRKFNAGVSAGWNTVLRFIFDGAPCWDHALVLNNDVVLPSGFYSELLSYDVPFVTGVATNNMTEMIEPHDRMPLSPHPDFSAFLIRRECWEKVGQFDERMVLYCSDCDFHIRAHRLGMPLWKANCPYFHVNSQTMKQSAPEDRAKIHQRANEDRVVFRSIYDCLPGTPEYEQIFRG